MQEYATHFNLLKDIVFNVNVKQAKRNESDTGWLLDVERANGQTEVLGFDKVVFCHGYQTKANVPRFEGQDKFEGSIIHSQAYRE